MIELIKSQMRKNVLECSLFSQLLLNTSNRNIAASFVATYTAIHVVALVIFY